VTCLVSCRPGHAGAKLPPPFHRGIPRSS
jgi:hypothetical protein